MRLDRYDAMATAATALTGLFYWAHAADVGLMGSARITAFAMLASGVTACATNGSRPGVAVSGTTWSNVMAFFGAVAMTLGLATLLLAYESTLTGLAVLVGGLWLVTTVKHLCETPAPPAERSEAEERELVDAR